MREPERVGDVPHRRGVVAQREVRGTDVDQRTDLAALVPVATRGTQRESVEREDVILPTITVVYLVYGADQLPRMAVEVVLAGDGANGQTPLSDPAGDGGLGDAERLAHVSRRELHRLLP